MCTIPAVEDRGWGITVAFSRIDHQGRRLVHDRQSGSDRRRASLTLEDLASLFFQLPSGDLNRPTTMTLECYCACCVIGGGMKGNLSQWLLT
jgi:hypothetical protein